LLRFLILTLLLAARLAAIESLDTVAKLRALSPAEAARELPVSFDATVIACDARGRNLYVRDATAATYVETRGPQEDTLEALKLRPGMRIRIEGTSRPGGYVPDMNQQHIEVLGQGPLPTPRRIGEDELLSPALDSQWVEVPAVVTGVERTSERFTLTVEVHGWKLKAFITRDEHATERAAELMQRPVRLQGIAGTFFNSERQMTGRYFAVPSFDQIIPTDVLAPTTTPPLRAANQLLRSDDTTQSLVRVEGVVTQTDGNDFYLRDASGSVLVHTAGKDAFAPGDWVEAEGFAAIASFRPVLRARKLTLTGHGEIPQPLSLDFDVNKITRFQAELIALDADFLARRDGIDDVVLQCRMGERFFEARLPVSNNLPNGLTPGDRIRLTGICELTTTNPLSLFWFVDGFRIHLPKTGGIVMLQRAPWWTLRHLLVILGIISAVACVALTWVWLLRRRVKEQTATIGSQLQKVAVQDERQRIARELHDTVEQGLASLSMQMGSITDDIEDMPTQVPAQLRKSFQLAQQIVRHCREDARASIQDLRNIELEQRGLSGALQELLPMAASGGSAEFLMQVTGEPRPLVKMTETHLLRIAQEAVNNAARHAAARHIRVTLDYSPATVTLTIRDDGRGFDLATPAPLGHFGLLGIHERSNKIQALLAVESAPDQGTTVRVVVPETVH
jgi:signal transduction histidine kinase